MAWQKTKIYLVSTSTNAETGKKSVHRYAVKKSKGKGKNVGQPVKLVLKKFNPITRKHETYTETKFK